MSNNVAFTSRIVPINSLDFNKITSRISKNNFSDYPWTLNEAVVGRDVFTNRICDCTCVVLSDGQKASLLHLNPAQKANHIMTDMIKFVTKNFNINSKDLTAVVVGSKNTKPSQGVYNNWINFLTSYNIPFTILKNGKTPTSVAYRTDTDEVLISNLTISDALQNKMSRKEALSSAFEHIFIANSDEI